MTTSYKMINGRVIVPPDPAFDLRREMLGGIQLLGPVAVRISIAAELAVLRGESRA